MRNFLIIILLINYPMQAFADIFQKVSDTQIKRTKEEVEDIGVLKNECEDIKSNLIRTKNSCQSSIDQYTSQINKCEGDLQNIKDSTGVEAVNAETEDNS